MNKKDRKEINGILKEFLVNGTQNLSRMQIWKSIMEILDNN